MPNSDVPEKLNGAASLPAAYDRLMEQAADAELTATNLEARAQDFLQMAERWRLVAAAKLESAQKIRRRHLGQEAVEAVDTP